MTTTGDLVRYDSERERYGIGSTNQVLSVTAGLPAWKTLTTADSVLTTQGDVLYESASGLARLGFGTSGDVLTTKGTGANPVWETPAGGSAVSYITGASVNSYSDNSPQFVGWESGGGSRTSTEVNAQLTFQTAFTLKRLSIACETNSKNADTSLNFRDDSSTVGLTCTIGSSTTGLFSGASDSTAVGAGSNCNFQLDTSSSGSGNLSVNGLMVEIST